MFKVILKNEKGEISCPTKDFYDIKNAIKGLQKEVAIPRENVDYISLYETNTAKTLIRYKKFTNEFEGSFYKTTLCRQDWIDTRYQIKFVYHFNLIGEDLRSCVYSKDYNSLKALKKDLDSLTKENMTVEIFEETCDINSNAVLNVKELI